MLVDLCVGPCRQLSGGFKHLPPPAAQNNKQQTHTRTNNAPPNPPNTYLRPGNPHVGVGIVGRHCHARGAEAEAARQIGDGELGEVAAVEEGEEGGALDARALRLRVVGWMGQGVAGRWVVDLPSVCMHTISQRQRPPEDRVCDVP